MKKFNIEEFLKNRECKVKMIGEFRKANFEMFVYYNGVNHRYDADITIDGVETTIYFETLKELIEHVEFMYHFTPQITE